MVVSYVSTIGARIPKSPVNPGVFGILKGVEKGCRSGGGTPSGVVARRERPWTVASYIQSTLFAQTKTCGRCEQPRPLDEFHRDSSKRDGLASTCKPCAIARARAWYAENQEAAREQRALHYRQNRTVALLRQQRWRDANQERHRESNRRHWGEYKVRKADRIAAYRAEHREEAAERARTWYQNNKERAFHNVSRRKAKFTTPPTEETLAFIRMLRRDRCAYCGGPAGTIDHIVPIAHGGPHDADNLTAACKRCNFKKKTKSLLAFIYETGLNEAALERRGG